MVRSRCGNYAKFRYLFSLQADAIRVCFEDFSGVMSRKFDRDIKGGGGKSTDSVLGADYLQIQTRETCLCAFCPLYACSVYVWVMEGKLVKTPALPPQRLCTCFHALAVSVHALYPSVSSPEVADNLLPGVCVCVCHPLYQRVATRAESTVFMWQFDQAKQEQYCRGHGGLCLAMPTKLWEMTGRETGRSFLYLQKSWAPESARLENGPCARLEGQACF